MTPAEYNDKQIAAGALSPAHLALLGPYGGSLEEQVVAFQRAHGLAADGMAGPKTVAALDALSEAEDKATARAQIAGWSPFDGPLDSRPRNRAELVALLGDPSSSDPKKPSPAWVKANIIECHPKLGNGMPGATARFYFKCHRLLEPYFREALRRCEEVAPGHVQRAGGFVFRRIRHSATGPLSFHSYGAAIDVNAAENRAREFKASRYPAPWSAAWRKLWPGGVTPEAVAAFESCGFSWGGRWQSYCDPMHFEWLGARAAKV